MDKDKMLSDVNLKSVYNYLDSNNDGHLTLDELRQELDQTKQQKGKNYFEELFVELDKDGSKSISFDEFKRAMRGAFDSSVKKSMQASRK
jgi:Ca2+-binding EF-hand superfamily protein